MDGLDTIIVFTADHGDMAGGHGMFWKSTQAFYDEVARVPLIISYPGRLKPGTKNMPVSSADIMPTLLESTGQKCPANVEGRSIVSSLDGKAHEPERPYVFCERISPNPARTRELLPGMSGSFMMRGEKWKYIRYADGEEYLYDLEKDPGEIQNLSRDAALNHQKEYLANKLNEWLAETHCPGFIQGKSTV